MKKSKILSKTILVVVLSVLLIALSVSTPTFSWFTRPQSSTGGSVSLSVPYGDKDPNGSALSMIAYDGSGVTMKHFVSTDEGVTFSPLTTIPPSGSLAKNKRVYYRTEITNGSTTPQNVSLYLKNFKPSGTGVNVCVGVNRPIKAFKNYTLYDQVIPPASNTKTTGTTMRVYFDVNRIQSGNAYNTVRNAWSGKNYYVCSGSSSTDIDSNSGSAGTYTAMVATGTSGVYYADIPYTHNKLYITVQDWGGTDYKRTQTFTDLAGDGLSRSSSILLFINGSQNDYKNAWAGRENVDGASFASWYSSASLAVGQEISIALSSSDYCAKTLTYNSSSPSVASVSDSGIITAVGAGTTTITYTATSAKDDKKTVTCTVRVQAISASNTTIKNAPIVTNLLIPAAKTANTENADKSNVEEVYWFIMNGDPMYPYSTTGTASYSHSGVYLGL